MDFDEEKEEKVDLLELWRVIVKRKWVIIISGVIVFLIIGMRTFTTTPQYKATATLLIENETSKVLSMENEFGLRSQFNNLRFFNTQLVLLKSESLAERVARNLNLPSRPEFSPAKKSFNISGFAKNLLSLKWIFPNKKPQETESDLLEELNPYSAAAERVRRNIEVSPIRETKVVKVSYTSPFPVLATKIVNTLAAEFISFSIEKRYETTQQASDFLSESIGNLNADLDAKERELQRYGKEKKLFFLNDTESTAVSKFADLNQAYTEAQIDRIKAEAVYLELKDSSLDSVPRFVNDPVIHQLKAEYTNMLNEYEEKSEIFKSTYPEMVQLKAKLDSMKKELKKAVDSAESEYHSALKKEGFLKNLLDQQRTNVSRMNSNAILYNSLKIEVENKRKLLNTLVERENEALVSARLGGFKTSSVSTIDKAKVPKSPVSPNKKLNFVLALLISVFGGGSLCFLLEYLDNTIKGPEEIEQLAGLPSIGVIPYLSPDGAKRKRKYGYHSGYGYSYSYGEGSSKEKEAYKEIKSIDLVNHFYPRFYLSEDYRTVRTSILLSHAGSPPKTITFSSALPEEGKTSNVANMGVAFSQLGKRILIIDADLRKPRLHRVFKVRNIMGLSGFLTGKVPIRDAVQLTNVENVWLIPSGPIPPNPSELLNSDRMRQLLEETQKLYDIVLLDSPPILAASDPVILSSLTDGIVLLVKSAKTTQKPFLSAVEHLKRANAKIIGVLFNEAKKGGGDYYYSKYHKYYRGSDYSAENIGN